MTPLAPLTRRRFVQLLTAGAAAAALPRPVRPRPVPPPRARRLHLRLKALRREALYAPHGWAG